MRAEAQEFLIASCRDKYSYRWRWRGRPVIQYPTDLVQLQEIIHATSPEVVVEVGVAHGGLTLFLLDMLNRCLYPPGRVVGVERGINPGTLGALSFYTKGDHPTLILREGDSTSALMVSMVQAVCDGKRTMVILDSDHHRDHVLAELRAYGPLVTSGCYLVVCDTVIEQCPLGITTLQGWDPGDNPAVAVRVYLGETKRFRVDTSIDDKLLISACPGGYLQCL